MLTQSAYPSFALISHSTNSPVTFQTDPVYIHRQETMMQDRLRSRSLRSQNRPPALVWGNALHQVFSVNTWHGKSRDLQYPHNFINEMFRLSDTNYHFFKAPEYRNYKLNLSKPFRICHESNLASIISFHFHIFHSDFYSKAFSKSNRTSNSFCPPSSLLFMAR